MRWLETRPRGAYVPARFLKMVFYIEIVEVAFEGLQGIALARDLTSRSYA